METADKGYEQGCMLKASLGMCVHVCIMNLDLHITGSHRLFQQCLHNSWTLALFFFFFVF